jgi:NAD(P)-dependent dehydrogenase (short-subunit alcohol dehydrogenase family)
VWAEVSLWPCPMREPRSWCWGGRCRSVRRLSTRSLPESGQALAQQCDVERRDQVESSVAECAERWGRIDLLVNNANTWTFESLRKTTDEDMETMWQSGPMASFRFMQSCFAHLRQSKGCVVNIGSGTSLMPMAGTGGYAMTKEAVRVLSRVGAVEWGRFGIRVNSICPVAMSPYTEAQEESHPGAIDRLTSMIPSDESGTPRPTSDGLSCTWPATPVGMSPARRLWSMAVSATSAEPSAQTGGREKEGLMLRAQSQS